MSQKYSFCVFILWQFHAHNMLNLWSCECSPITILIYSPTPKLFFSTILLLFYIFFNSLSLTLTSWLLAWAWVGELFTRTEASHQCQPWTSPAPQWRRAPMSPYPKPDEMLLAPVLHRSYACSIAAVTSWAQRCVVSRKQCFTGLLNLWLSCSFSPFASCPLSP